MKIIIPSKGRHDTISTHEVFKDYDYYVIVHSEEERQEYSLNKSINPRRILVSGTKPGVSFQRQWVLDNLIVDGEWFITADDNITDLTGVAESHYENEELYESDKSLKDIFSTPLSTVRFMKIVEEMICISHKENIKYCGFAVVDNYYFRLKKYRNVGYVISKLAIIKKDKNINYDENVLAMDDYAYTAENLSKIGKVLINNFVYPISKHYMKGGIGTYEERLPKKKQDCVYLMKKYPGLFRYKVKSNCDPKAELQVAFINLEQVEKWRQKINNSLANF